MVEFGARSLVKATLLPLSEKRAIFWAARKLFIIDHQLRRRGVAEVRSELGRYADPPSALFSNISPHQISRIVERGARISIGRKDSCLRHSLLLWWILKQRGIYSELRVGVNSQEGKLDGHAWVEVDGQPVNDRKGISELYTMIEL